MPGFLLLENSKKNSEPPRPRYQWGDCPISPCSFRCSRTLAYRPTHLASQPSCKLKPVISFAVSLEPTPAE